VPFFPLTESTALPSAFQRWRRVPALAGAAPAIARTPDAISAGSRREYNRATVRGIPAPLKQTPSADETELVDPAAVCAGVEHAGGPIDCDRGEGAKREVGE